MKDMQAIKGTTLGYLYTREYTYNTNLEKTCKDNPNVCLNCEYDSCEKGYCDKMLNYGNSQFYVKKKDRVQAYDKK